MFKVARYRWLCSTACVLTLSLCGSVAAQEVSPAALSQAIKSSRVSALQDRQPVDFCDVPMFWSPDGRIIDDGMLAPASLPRVKADCTPRPTGVFYAKVHRVEIFADSVVVRGASRFNDVARSETMVFHRERGLLRFFEARISGIMFLH